MQLSVESLLFGLASAASLPLGALLGIWLQPSEKTTACWMGIGSGCLVYAVATQLFGAALYEFFMVSPDPFGESNECDSTCEHKFGVVLLQDGCAVLGALVYYALSFYIPHLVLRCSPKRANRSMEEQLLNTSAIGSSDLDEQERPRRTTSTTRFSITIPGGNPNDDGDVEEGFEQAGTITLGGSEVAIAMWLGLALDAIPESLMLGFMANEGSISFAFLFAIFLGNFPEAFAGGAELHRDGMPLARNFFMWFSVFAGTGLLALVGSLIMPQNIRHGSRQDYIRDRSTAAMEGIVGGAMFAMIATSMLPAAFKGAERNAGLFFVMGFVFSVLVGVLGARFGEVQDDLAP